jgi:sulfate transport system permease protein
VATSAAAIQRERVVVRNNVVRGDSMLPVGIVTTFLSVIVLLPLAAVAARAFTGGTFWSEAFASDALASLRLSLVASFGVALAGLTLVALYGPNSPVHIDVAYTPAAVFLALLFVTLPFVVRSVQPVLMDLDREMEEAAASLGAGILQTYARIIFPTVLPALISGVALGFARALGEFGSVVLISGNIPYKTEVASVHVFGQIESGDIAGAASVSVILLILSSAVLLALNALQRRGLRHGG